MCKYTKVKLDRFDEVRLFKEERNRDRKYLQTSFTKPVLWHIKVKEEA